jgi:hypothetical protein
MAGSGRRFALAVILMPLLFLAMAGLSHATLFTVTSLSGEPAAPAACGLVDAIAAANGTHNVCGISNGNDIIEFALTGTIVIDEPLVVNDANLTIQGRIESPVIIDGDGVTQIIDHESGNLTLNNLTLQNGNADPMLAFEGGAVLANSTDDLFINDCTFKNNFAEAGGAIFGGFGTVIIINSTFANNSADPAGPGAGGAIFNNGSALEITNCTFFKNDAATDLGGGLGWQSGFAPSVNSSIFESIDPSGNTDDSDNCQASDLVNDGGFNISDDETCFSGSTSSDINTALNLDAAGLANNGGPTQTVLPEAGSPAIDFVPIGNCFDFNSNPITNDQRLFLRPDLDLGVPEAFCDAGAVETGEGPQNGVPPITIVPNSLKLQIARSTTPNSDQVNAAFTFTFNGDPNCGGPGAMPGMPEGDEDAFNGFDVSVFESTCAALPLHGLMLDLPPFQTHTVNHQKYGTVFETSSTATLQQPSEIVSARMIALHPPAGACGSWALNLEVSGLNTSDTTTVNLPGGNPFALVVADFAGDASVCFDVTNAIVGNQPPPPPPPPVHRVRRRVRR